MLYKSEINLRQNNLLDKSRDSSTHIFLSSEYDKQQKNYRNFINRKSYLFRTFNSYLKYFRYFADFYKVSIISCKKLGKS